MTLRELELETHFDVHGVPATVTRPAPEETPIATRVIWPAPTESEFPGGFGNQRSEAIRVMALRRDQVPTVPKGTRIVAPPDTGGADREWVVDATARIEFDITRVLVLEIDEP